MILATHGAAGGWDELAIAVVAFAVLWVAVKLAGRKPAGDDDDEDEGQDFDLDGATEKIERQPKDPAPPATPLG